MSDKERFQAFFAELGVRNDEVVPGDIVLEMDHEVDWANGLCVGQLWFLFGEDGNYLGFVNDETMEFEPRATAS